MLTAKKHQDRKIWPKSNVFQLVPGSQ